MTNKDILEKEIEKKEDRKLRRELSQNQVDAITKSSEQLSNEIGGLQNQLNDLRAAIEGIDSHESLEGVMESINAIQIPDKVEVLNPISEVKVTNQKDFPKSIDIKANWLKSLIIKQFEDISSIIEDFKKFLTINVFKVDLSKHERKGNALAVKIVEDQIARPSGGGGGRAVYETLTGKPERATIDSLGTKKPVHVAIVDGSGDQITSFGSSSVYQLVYAVKSDDANVSYKCHALAGSLPSEAVWRIERLTVDGDNLIGVYADGDTNFDNILNNREELDYLDITL